MEFTLFTNVDRAEFKNHKLSFKFRSAFLSFVVLSWLLMAFELADTEIDKSAFSDYRNTSVEHMISTFSRSIID